MDYKLVIFDLDGTLLDTIEDLAEAVNHALRVRGLPLHSLEEYRGMVGHGVRNLVATALERSMASGSDALIDKALADFTEYYCAHIDVHTRPYPGMVDLVKDLDAAGVRMAVASNKFQSGAEKLVREFFPGIPFIAILGNREGFPLKPDPETVGEILRAASMSQAVAVLVGDSRTDMQTAFNGGISAIAVGWGYRSTEDLENAIRDIFGPDSPSNKPVAGSVTELRTLLFGRPFFVSGQMSTPPEQPSTPLQQAVYEAFARLDIPFVRVDTDPGITMEDCLHIDEGLGARIVKTVFVCNRQQTEFYLYAMPADKPFVTREFCAALGIPRVSFASAEKLLELTGVAPGATTILSAVLSAVSPDSASTTIVSPAAGVHLVMDRALAAAEWFACTDGTPTCFVKLRTRDLLDKYIPATCHDLTLI